MPDKENHGTSEGVENKRNSESINRRKFINQSSLTQQNSTVRRRGFVKSAVASLASVVGISAATETALGSPHDKITEKRRLKAVEPYKNKESVINALENNRDLLQRLTDKGLLEATSPAEIVPDTIDAPHEEGESGGVRFDTKGFDGVTPELRVVKPTPKGILTIAVLPEVDKRYSLLNSDEREDPVVIEAASFGDSTNGGLIGAIVSEMGVVFRDSGCEGCNTFCHNCDCVASTECTDGNAYGSCCSCCCGFRSFVCAGYGCVSDGGYIGTACS